MVGEGGVLKLRMPGNGGEDGPRKVTTFLPLMFASHHPHHYPCLLTSLLQPTSS